MVSQNLFVSSVEPNRTVPIETIEPIGERFCSVRNFQILIQIANMENSLKSCWATLISIILAYLHKGEARLVPFCTCEKYLAGQCFSVDVLILPSVDAMEKKITNIPLRVAALGRGPENYNEKCELKMWTKLPLPKTNNLSPNNVEFHYWKTL